MFNIKKDFSEIKGLFKKINNRDFQGNKGTALKNSSYQFLINLTMKFGSLFFTILMARILLPEKMGLYSLALSTIVFFAAFSDLGISNALLTYIPKKLSQNKPSEAKAYFNLFLKLKIYLLIIISLTLLVLSYPLSKIYYNQPIFYALLIGVFYIMINGLLSFYEQLFKSVNNFRVPLVKEIIFQLLRLFLVPLSLILILKKTDSSNIILLVAFTLISFSYLASLFYSLKQSKHLSLLKIKASEISETEKKSLIQFMFPLAITSLSGIFFGYIDIIMLGRYVQSEFISYYTTAFSLASSIGVIISFISIGIFPILSSLNKDNLNFLLKKALKYSFLISLLCSTIILLGANLFIHLLYGVEYLPAAIVLRYYTLIILTYPLISLYENYFISQKKTEFLATTLFITTLINIFLNFFFIRYGVSHYDGIGGILGACFATIISRIVYFVALFFKKKKPFPFSYWAQLSFIPPIK